MLTVCSPCRAFEMQSRAQCGDCVALAILETVDHVIELAEHDAPTAPICLLCGADFWRDQLPALCSAKHPTCEAMERDYIRSNLILDLRVLPQPLSEAGHA